MSKRKIFAIIYLVRYKVGFILSRIIETNLFVSSKDIRRISSVLKSNFTLYICVFLFSLLTTIKKDGLALNPTQITLINSLFFLWKKNSNLKMVYVPGHRGLHKSRPSYEYKCTAFASTSKKCFSDCTIRLTAPSLKSKMVGVFQFWKKGQFLQFFTFLEIDTTNFLPLWYKRNIEQ